MKNRAFILLLMTFMMASCHTVDTPIIEEEEEEEIIEEESSLLLLPTDAVQLTVANETFTVDFTLPSSISLAFDIRGSYVAVRYNTRDSLIFYYCNFYQPRPCGTTPLSLPFYIDSDLTAFEYHLAQECFSDDCDTKTRIEVMRMLVEKQKQKWVPENYFCYESSTKTGIFLMAVILVKEYEDSAKFIDAETLREALLFLDIINRYFESEDITDFTDYNSILTNFNNYIIDFNHLMIEVSEQFLSNNK